MDVFLQEVFRPLTAPVNQLLAFLIIYLVRSFTLNNRTRRFFSITIFFFLPPKTRNGTLRFRPPTPCADENWRHQHRPTFATILVTHVELNSNASSIYSTRGDGVHGHLDLTINPADYKQRSIGGVAFQVPTAPPAFPVHKDKATDAEIAEENRQHKALLSEFFLWHNVDAILRNLLIIAVPTIFLAAVRNPVTGFSNVSCMSLLNHIHDIYGHIT
jgi:hypothetical protein